MTDTGLRTILWRCDPLNLYEYSALTSAGQGLHLAGTVVAAEAGKPLRIDYQVVLDEQNLTQAVTVNVSGGLGEHHIALAVDAQRAWTWNGRALPECQGLADVDLGFSPCTNTLPIRRLNLNPGESRNLTAVWVRYPEFDVIPFSQRYTRLDSRRYLFESLISDFKAELTVDDLGLVRRYEGLWEAAAVGEMCE